MNPTAWILPNTLHPERWTGIELFLGGGGLLLFLGCLWVAAHGPAAATPAPRAVPPQDQDAKAIRFQTPSSH